MMKNMLIIFLILSLSSCGKNGKVLTEYVTVPVPTVEILPPDLSIQNNIDELVDIENSYRDELGQAPLSQGLTCSIHNNSNPDLNFKFGTAAYTFSLHTDFNQPEIDGTTASNILPEILRTLYVGQKYSLRCTGYLVVLESDLHSFTLNSDDGSRLMIDGVLVIDNRDKNKDDDKDNKMLAKSGSIVLERGIYSFQLDYSQSDKGNQGLILSSNNEVVDNAFFYR